MFVISLVERASENKLGDVLYRWLDVATGIAMETTIRKENESNFDF